MNEASGNWNTGTENTRHQSLIRNILEQVKNGEKNKSDAFHELRSILNSSSRKVDAVDNSEREIKESGSAQYGNSMGVNLRTYSKSERDLDETERNFRLQKPGQGRASTGAGITPRLELRAPTPVPTMSERNNSMVFLDDFASVTTNDEVNWNPSTMPFPSTNIRQYDSGNSQQPTSSQPQQHLSQYVGNLSQAPSRPIDIIGEEAERKLERSASPSSSISGGTKRSSGFGKAINLPGHTVNRRGNGRYNTQEGMVNAERMVGGVERYVDAGPNNLADRSDPAQAYDYDGYPPNQGGRMEFEADSRPPPSMGGGGSRSVYEERDEYSEEKVGGVGGGNYYDPYAMNPYETDEYTLNTGSDLNRHQYPPGVNRGGIQPENAGFHVDARSHRMVRNEAAIREEMFR